MKIRKFLSKFLKKVGSLLCGFASCLYKSPQSKRVIPWFAVNGDETLRLNYSLDEKSIVFDVGGYKGQWASDIFTMYGCYIYIFEPVAEYVKRIEKRFSKNPKIKTYSFGLATKNKVLQIGVDESRSSIFKPGKKIEKIKLVRAIDFIKQNDIYSIDLMKINIEGGEYELLEHFIDTGFVTNIGNIQVQFHDFIPNAQNRMKRIQSALSKTHRLTYQYPFVWENWQIKDDNC